MVANLKIIILAFYLQRVVFFRILVELSFFHATTVGCDVTIISYLLIVKLTICFQFYDNVGPFYF